MKTDDDYRRMQKSFYDDPQYSPELIVGNYQWQENFPYETNLLYRYADVRLPLFADTRSLIALDVGCGPGRMVGRMAKLFRQVDGVDISARLLAVARQKYPQSRFFEAAGADLGAAPANEYDFVYSTIALQHIAVNSIRQKIFREILRVLKPGGKFTLQFAYLDTYPYIFRRSRRLTRWFGVTRADRVRGHAQWDEERTDATSTNSDCDVVLSPESLPLAVRELEGIFGKNEHWFYDVRICRDNLRGARHDPYWASHWVFFHGTKAAA